MNIILNFPDTILINAVVKEAIGHADPIGEHIDDIPDDFMLFGLTTIMHIEDVLNDIYDV